MIRNLFTEDFHILNYITTDTLLRFIVVLIIMSVAIAICERVGKVVRKICNTLIILSFIALAILQIY